MQFSHWKTANKIPQDFLQEEIRWVEQRCKGAGKLFNCKYITLIYTYIKYIIYTYIKRQLNWALSSAVLHNASWNKAGKGFMIEKTPSLTSGIARKFLAWFCWGEVLQGIHPCSVTLQLPTEQGRSPVLSLVKTWQAPALHVWLNFASSGRVHHSKDRRRAEKQWKLGGKTCF